MLNTIKLDDLLVHSYSGVQEFPPSKCQIFFLTQEREPEGI